MNTTVTRYDTAFYVQALDRFVATGECAETDTEPLYAYLLSVMNDSMVKVQVLGDEICARIFYDTMIQFIQLNLEKERYNLRKSQSERTGMKLVLEWSMAKRKDGWQALLQQISDKYREYGFDSRFYRSHFGTEGGYADDEVWEKMVDDWEDAFQLKMHEEKEKEIAFRKDALERRLRSKPCFPLSLPIRQTANWKICSSTNTSPASSRPSAINRKSCSLPGVSKPSPPVPKVR